MTYHGISRLIACSLLFLMPICVRCACAGAQARIFKSLDSGRDCSIRGMSIPRNDIIWVSGSKGHVARTTDGGLTWSWMTVGGFENTDFRDIHAFDSSSAVIMGIGNPAFILRTADGGRSWKTVFTKEASGMFLDAMDFSDDRHGICIGDPLDDSGAGRTFYIIRTTDGGGSWQEDPTGERPSAQAGEAVFSASGSNIALLEDGGYAFVSGGLSANLYVARRKRRQVKICPLPIVKGTQSSGAFSMATNGKEAFYCIGGDYKEPAAAKNLFTWTTDGGNAWNVPEDPAPSGYRSCVRLLRGGGLIACGTNGVDIGTSPGKWQRISDTGFNVCAPSPDGRRVFFAGTNGRISVMDFQKRQGTICTQHQD